MGISAKEAAKSVGISKHGIIKSIRDGRISATKNTNGEWEIEPSELFRVYTPINLDNSEQNNQSQQQYTHKINSSSPLENQILKHETDKLQEKIQIQEKMIEELKSDKEDYKNRLDRAQNIIEKQTYLLSDMREKTLEKPPERQKGFWAAILGKNN